MSNAPTPAPSTQPQILLLHNHAESPTPADPVTTIAACDSQGRPWMFLFYSDPGYDIAITPTGSRYHVYTWDGSTPTGVPADLWAVVMRACEEGV